MVSFLIQYLLKLAGTEVAKLAIGIAVNKLISSADDGITKDVAKVMIDGIAKSKANPTTKDMFNSVVKELGYEPIKGEGNA